jgi:transposase-like protein
MASQRGRRDPERERFWRRAIREWARSGDSIRGFCAARGLTETAFHAWRRELRRRDGERERRPITGIGPDRPSSKPRPKRTTGRGRVPATPPPFLPVRLTTAGTAAVEIERHGTTVRLHGAVDAELLVRILDALERASC